MKSYTIDEVLETLGMVKVDNFDIRTVTLGINLLPAAAKNSAELLKNVEGLVLSQGKDLVSEIKTTEKKYGVPIINKRITITPASLFLASSLTGKKDADLESVVALSRVLDQCAADLGVDFLGGFGALVERGIGYSERIVLESLPRVLTETERVCSFVNIGSSRAGINMRAVAKIGSLIHEISERPGGELGCAKLVVFCNAVSDNPFMAGGFHGVDQADAVVNVGVSGPGVVRRAIERLPEDLPLDLVAKEIQNTAFKITRAGELVGREIALALGVQFGSVDLSLAPTTAPGDSVGLILERLGLETVGAHGTTAALALLTDAVKKGGAMASTSVGGLSGAFIPVAEDSTLAAAAAKGVLNIDKLEAMTAVCSVGLDMIAVPGATRSTTLAAIIADEAAIGMINGKTTAVRLIPVKGKKAGETVRFGGLLGESVILPVHGEKSDQFIWRKGRIPAPITSLRN